MKKYKFTWKKLVLVIVLYFVVTDIYDFITPTPIWGDESDEPYLTITGKKPTVVVQLFWPPS